MEARRRNEGRHSSILDNQGSTALHLAIREGHVEIVGLLLEMGADVKATCGTLSIRPLHLGAMTLNPPMMECILKYCPNLESRCNGLTALFYAVSTGDYAVVRLLLEAGADAKARTLCEPGTGESVLHMAVGSFKQTILPLLIRYGADVNSIGKNPAGQTALHIAAQYGNEDGLRELIKNGANVFATFPDGRTALDVAAKAGQVNTASALIEHGLDPLLTRAGGISSVYLAAIHDQNKLLVFLLDRYTTVMPKELKIKIVIGAAGTGRIRILRILSARGFPILGANDISGTGLLMAAYYGHKDVVVYLLRHGANPLQQASIKKMTSLDMAMHGKQAEVLNILQEAVRQRAANPGVELFPKWKYTEKDSPSELAEDLACAMSVNATTRLQQNQQPPGLFICNVCKDLDFRRGMARDAEIVFFIIVTSMNVAASRGCRGCQFLSDCVAQAKTAYGPGLWGNMPVTELVLHSMAHGAPLLLHPQGGNPVAHPSQRVEIYVEKGSGTTWPTIGFGRDVSLPGWSEGRAEMTRNLLRECTTNHKHCSYQTGPLPSRVIWVGSTSEQPRLYISKGERANYVALSHCWGGASPLKTETHTISQRMQGIPWKDLPKTFQDAIIVTRSLGVNYLYIDSLCIIQNSREDWEREATKMKDVYANCYAMISADDSPNPHGGCFPSDTDGSRRSHAVESVGPRLSKVKAFIRLIHLRDTFHMEVCHRIGDQQVAPELSRAVLNRRGWCLQERVLAPRILHFGRSELAWECPETIACECQLVVTSRDKESRFKALLGDHLLRRAVFQDDGDATSHPMDILLWMHFIEEFTRRQLTYDADMLYALSGLAAFMALATKAEYICGIWKTELAEFLLWKVDYGSNRSDLPLAAPLPFRVQTSDSSSSVCPRRHKAYYVPSWSWASVIGPISFLVGRLDTSDKDQISHVRKDGKIERVKTHRKPLLEAVDFEYTPDSLNPFGPPRQASLTIRGQTLPVTYASKTLSTNGNGGTLNYIPTSTSYETTPFVVRFELDLPHIESGVSIGDSLVLLYVVLDLDATVADENDGPWGVKGKRLAGLVLAAVEARETNSDRANAVPVYRRVGVFMATGDKWLKEATTRTVKLV